MIAEDFLFDTAKIKAKLGWRPTLTNEQMLVAPTSTMPRSVRRSMRGATSPPTRKPASMGVIRLLKWIS